MVVSASSGWKVGLLEWVGTDGDYFSNNYGKRRADRRHLKTLYRQRVRDGRG